ncbi:MAG: FtsQ-type POTRA domain-containing protein [Terriglobales bacterium]|jgi:cell division protein FtsQ
MARKSGSTISQEELYPQADEPSRQELDDAHVLDLDVDDESPFLRGQKRVSVRRGTLPKKAATRLTWAALAALVVLVCGLAVTAVYHYGEHSWRFRVDSSDDIEISGLGNVTRAQVIEVMGGDIGRNIFFIPLDERQKQIEQIPWVESASVMRFVPNRIKIEIHERMPVAFVRIGSKIQLTDGSGTLMELPVGSKKKFSFPVILGMNAGEPQSTRAPRMKIYNQLLSELDSEGAHYSQDLSEVDLSDSDDVKVLANDAGGEVLVHLGASDFLRRFKIYISHAQEWRQQFARLDSVDLRYEHQIVVNPDLQGPAKQPPLSLSVAKAAVAAGVKPAALVTHEVTPPKPAGPAPALASSTKPTAKPKAPAGKKKFAKAHHRKPPAKKAEARVRPANTTAPQLRAATQAPSPATQTAPPATSTASPVVRPSTNATKPQKPSAGIPKGQP